MARPIRWFVPSLTLFVLGAVACGGGKETGEASKPPPERSSEAKVIKQGSPSIGEGRGPDQPPEHGRKAPAMPRTTRTDFYMTSPTIVHHGAIPARHTCDGEGVSPTLTWHNPPKEANAFALVVDDPDAQNGPFVHWIVANLPADALTLPESMAGESVLKDVRGAMQGKNGAGKTEWQPLCPQPGRPHRYVFRLYALAKPLDLPAGPTRADLEKAIKGNFVGQAAIIASYARK